MNNGAKNKGKDTVVAQELVVSALAGYPTIKKAKEFLEIQGYDFSEQRLENLQRSKAEDIAEMKVRLAPQIESHLTKDMLSEAQRITEVIGLAVERTEQRLTANIVSDPSKVARDLAQVRTQAFDKMLALEGRPQHIHETRTLDDLQRALVSLGVAEVVDSTATEPKQLPEETDA